MSENYFQLFDIEPAFDIDIDLLKERYRQLQRSVHPDKFTQAQQRERRLSVQQAALINDAFNTLKTPINRARYLLGLRGINLDEQDNTAMDAEFLMEQMSLREGLAEVRDAQQPMSRLGDFQQLLDTKFEALMAELSRCFQQNSPASLQQAVGLVHKLQFFDKLAEEAEQLEHELEEF